MSHYFCDGRHIIVRVFKRYGNRKTCIYSYHICGCLKKSWNGVCHFSVAIARRGNVERGAR